jgi:hypothetical protein
MKKRTIVNHCRKGPLSNQDKANIEEFMLTMDDIDIAQRLNRPLKQIERYRKEAQSKAPRLIAKRSETEELRRELHALSVWSNIKQQFTDKELVFYENSYIEYRRQFKDLLPTELKQLMQLITLDIMSSRHNIERKHNIEEIDRIEKLLESYHKTTPSTLTDKEKLFIIHNEEMLMACKAASASKTKEYKDLLDKHTDILKTLKSTRDQRIKSLEDRGKFIDILEQLEIQSRRQNISEIVGLMDLAVAKEELRLSQAHQYFDGTIDQPLYNFESAKLNEETEPENPV